MFWSPNGINPRVRGGGCSPSAGSHPAFPRAEWHLCRQIASTCPFYVVATALSVAVPEQSRIRGDLARKFSKREQPTTYFVA